MSSDHLASTEFAVNPASRCAVALVLDISGSMGGAPIDELNASLIEFDKALKANSQASSSVELVVISFGGETIVGEFVTADTFVPPTLVATGDTPMGAAVMRGLEAIKTRKETYRKNGIDYYRPWVILITDGAPTDAGVWEMAASQLKLEEDRKGLIVYPIGVSGADLQILGQFSNKRTPILLHGLQFKELFQWLSSSLSAVSQSKPGDQVALPAVGWGSIEA